jgi:hypothetical protein
MPAVSPSQGVDCCTWGSSDVRFDLEAHPMHPFRTVDGCLFHVMKQLEGTAVPISFRSSSPDLRNTDLAMGVTVLLERPKARQSLRRTTSAQHFAATLRSTPSHQTISTIRHLCTS